MSPEARAASVLDVREQPTDPSPRRLPHEFGWYLAAIVGLCALAALMVVLRAGVFHLGYPFDTVFFFPKERFSDFTIFAKRFPYLGTNKFWGDFGGAFNYPPLLIVAMATYYSLPSPLFSYLATVVLTACGLIWLLALCLSKRGISPAWAIVFAAFSSYPLFFLLDRANVEGLVWIASSLALISLARQRWWWTATFLAVATALKIFPVLLLPLLLSKKKWRELAYAAALSIWLSLICLWLVGPSMRDAFAGLRFGFGALHSLYLVRDLVWEMGFTHSAFSVVKLIMILRGFCSAYYLWPAYRIYAFSVAILGLLLYFGRIRRLPLLNQVLALTSCSLLFPWWSAEYTLVHLYVPSALLMLWILDHPGQYGKRLLYYLLPFAIALTPQPYFYLGLRSYSGQVKAVALVVLLISSLYLPLEDRTLDGQTVMRRSNGDMEDATGVSSEQATCTISSQV